MHYLVCYQCPDAGVYDSYGILGHCHCITMPYACCAWITAMVDAGGFALVHGRCAVDGLHAMPCLLRWINTCVPLDAALEFLQHWRRSQDVPCCLDAVRLHTRTVLPTSHSTTVVPGCRTSDGTTCDTHRCLHHYAHYPTLPCWVITHH